MTREKILRPLDPDVHAYIVECIRVRPVGANDHFKQDLAEKALEQLGSG